MKLLNTIFAAITYIRYKIRTKINSLNLHHKKSNKMSLLSTVFTALESFVEKVFGIIKKEWNNLDPLAQTYIKGAIKFVNVLKAAVAGISTGNVTIDAIISTAEGLIGTSLVETILNILGEVLIDLGIVQQAITDPKEALAQWLDHVGAKTGNSLSDILFDTAKYIAIKLIPSLSRSKAIVLIQWVFDTFFAGQAAVVLNVPVVSVSTPVSVEAPVVAVAPITEASA